MTLPASGTITYNDFNIEAGRASQTNIDMAWIYNNTKSGQQSYSINNYYSKAWYLKNNTTPGNCDTRAWFQNNCNCDCVCDCGGDCVCICCFPGDALVTVADGSKKRIDEIKIGDVVQGGYGYLNNVQMIHESTLGSAKMYVINGRHRTTSEHKHLTTEGWAVIELSTGTAQTRIRMTVDNNGKKEWHTNTKLQRTKTLELKVGMTLVTTTGNELITSIEIDESYNSDALVYTLCTDGSHTHIVSENLIVGAWLRDNDFDYNNWKPIKKETYNEVYNDVNFLPTSKRAGVLETV